MTKTLTAQKANLSAVAGILSVLVLAGAFGVQQASAALVSPMAIGTRSAQVTQLQQFLAANSAIYPEGLVTGYFGPLTAAAVTQFQLNYDISPVGQVGPITLARMNAVMNSGLTLDIAAPVITGHVVQVNGLSATLRWDTNSQASGKVHYATQPLQVQEAQTSFTAPYISGLVANGLVGAYNQSVTINGLQSNTVYYYVVESADPSGNVSVLPQSSFRTN